MHNVDDIPGKVVACFRPSRVIQNIDNDNVYAYTQRLWNELSGQNEYEIEKLDSVWDFLSDEQTEDLLFLYLQYFGWVVVPNSRKKDTMAYEFYCVNKTTYERAIVQVKSGYSCIDLNNYKDFPGKIFLLQPNNCFSGDCLPNMEIVPTSAIESFVHGNKEIIPSSIIRWFNLMK